MENKTTDQVWELWMIISLFSVILFPVTGVIAAVKMNKARYSDYSTAKQWTIATYVLFAVTYLVLLTLMSIHFINLIS